MSITTGSHGSIERDKLMEILDKNKKESNTPKTVEDSLKQVISNWQIANATYYDPKDSSQTRKDCDGSGAFGRMIKSGSIALGSTFTSRIKEKGLDVFIQIKDFNIDTPYGKGIFRVDDAMASRFNKKDKFRIDFFHEDLSLKQKLEGRFKVMFKLIKIRTAGS
ncbi:MAG: hypothetical protein WCI91_03660 [Candidatus Nomurabacteria bacterium]